MNSIGGRQGRSLIFRTYLIIAGGLVLIALVLDFGFARLNAGAEPVPRWADDGARLIELYLATTPQAQWPAALSTLSATLGYPVQALPRDHVVAAGRGQPDGITREVLTTDGRSTYVRTSARLGATIVSGPRDEGPPSAVARWLPPLFYLSIFAFVAVWLWPLIRDLNVIAGAAREFATDYRRPIETASRTRTLKELATNFDEMSARISALIRSQKDLTSALSHEMRTPLTRIKFAMAVMGDTRGVSAELDSISTDIEEIDRLITAMLEYARLDHPGTTLNCESVPTDAWLAHTVDKARGLGPAIDVRNHAAGTTLFLDAGLMGLALSNLLVNAARYARDQVTLTLEVRGDEAVLTVDDDGPGIPAAERDTVFDAFRRLDDSRNKNTGGHGLGLAIVQRVAALHGGVAAVERSTLGGARFTLRWPLRAAGSLELGSSKK